MRFTDSDLQATEFFNAELGSQTFHQTWLKLYGHQRHRLLRQNREDSSDDEPVAIPPDVIRFPKTTRCCGYNCLGDIDIHLHDPSMLISRTHKKDLAETAGALGTLRFPF
jgi:hypothetical protein